MTNLVVAGITSNPNMREISLTKKDEAIKKSVIKTNYVFTITKKAVSKKLFKLNKKKKSLRFNELNKRIEQLKN